MKNSKRVDGSSTQGGAMTPEKSAAKREKLVLYEANEKSFEEKCLEIIKNKDWQNLEQASVNQLDEVKGKSPKGFFYLGVALYKMGAYGKAIKSFQKSGELNANDAQVQYNLGLSYFKEEKYTLAVEHLKICTMIDPLHKYAYNNLAFIYNMHQYY